MVSKYTLIFDTQKLQMRIKNEYSIAVSQYRLKIVIGYDPILITNHYSQLTTCIYYRK